MRLAVIGSIYLFLLAVMSSKTAIAEQTPEQLRQTEEAEVWGEWATKPVPSEKQKYGVGMQGKDENDLNRLDHSSLLDYPQEKTAVDHSAAETDFDLLRELEDELLDDLGD